MERLAWLMFCVTVSGYTVREDTTGCCTDGQQMGSREYFRCEGGSWTAKYCDRGWTYSTAYGSCQVEQPTETHQSTQDLENIYCGPPSICPLGEFLPDYCDCHKFYQCDHGSEVHMTCGPGTAFNPAIKTCDWPYNVKLCQTLGQS